MSKKIPRDSLTVISLLNPLSKAHGGAVPGPGARWDVTRSPDSRPPCHGSRGGFSVGSSGGTSGSPPWGTGARVTTPRGLAPAHGWPPSAATEEGYRSSHGAEVLISLTFREPSQGARRNEEVGLLVRKFSVWEAYGMRPPVTCDRIFRVAQERFYQMPNR